MNEEQVKEITILAKELGFKPVTFSTKRVFVEIIEGEHMAGDPHMNYYLLLCEIQLWLISKRIFVSTIWTDDFTRYFYTIIIMDKLEYCEGSSCEDSLPDALATGILQGLNLIKNESN